MMDKAVPGALLLAFFIALSGCAGKPPPASETLTGTTTATSATIDDAAAQRPTWVLGQGWAYTVEVPGEPTRKFNMLVAEERGDLWVVASNDRTQAIHHAVYSTNPVLGRIGKQTLSPFQDGQAVQMYQFPLVDGKSWRAKFFGEDKTFTATYAGDIDVRAVNAKHNLGTHSEGFRITAQGSGGQKVLYDHVEAAGWFTSFEVLDAAGEREIKLTLTDIISGYKGNYYFFRGEDALVQTETHQANSGLTPRTLQAPIADGFDDQVALGIVFTGAASTIPPSANVTLKDPAGATLWSRDFNTATQVHELRDFVGKAGTWTVELRLTGDVQIEVRVVGISNYAQGVL